MSVKPVESRVKVKSNKKKMKQTRTIKTRVHGKVKFREYIRISFDCKRCKDEIICDLPNRVYDGLFCHTCGFNNIW
jgi:hypothetical protein